MKRSFAKNLATLVKKPQQAFLIAIIQFEVGAFSLRLGHGAALTCPRHVIHYRTDTSLPPHTPCCVLDFTGCAYVSWFFDSLSNISPKSIALLGLISFYNGFVMQESTLLRRLHSLKWRLVKAVSCFSPYFACTWVTSLRYHISRCFVHQHASSSHFALCYIFTLQPIENPALW